MSIPSAVVPTPTNEPILGYLPGSPERVALQDEIARQRSETIDIPIIIGGEEIRTGNTVNAVVPHDHGHVLATVHRAGKAEIAKAIEVSTAAQHDWMRMAPEARSAIFLRAAELLAGPWRQKINAATVLNQSKTCFQAEIDSACELIDFLRFNTLYQQQIIEQIQPPVSGDGVWNMVECRPLEGFVYAVTPFNFTAIAGNLPAAPALMGNSVIWKPSSTSLYSNYLVMRLFEEAGVPPGVINFVPGNAASMTEQLTSDPNFAGLHFTGSTEVFQLIWAQLSSSLPKLRSYPRIVGETGGKDFIVAHESAEPKALVTAMVRGAYEYQGQKCSAASRAYVPRSLWSEIRFDLISEIETITMGSPEEFPNFMGAVIDQGSYDKCKKYIDAAAASSDADVIAGGACDDSTGYFVGATLIEAKTPDYASMCEEIFGPIMTVYVYDDGDFEGALKLCDETSPYALTGAIFARDRAAVVRATDRLKFAAGNFYINDKPTGAVVGQQPFGGGRASGTNDKAGSPLNLYRWINPRTIKETLVSPTDYRYGFLGADS